MKKRVLFAPCFLLCLLLALTLASCADKSQNFEGYTKVIFELEGGEYQNSQRPIVFYYDYGEGESHIIKELTDISGDDFIRRGYILDGWYTEKMTSPDGNTTYSGKWDFENDRVTDKEITLYAKWDKAIKYSFEVCYREDDGSVKVLGSYSVSAGEKFDDYMKFSGKRKGYTALGTYKDVDGNPVDESFAHPGGESDLAIQVFPDYIEGTYSLVSNVNDLAKSKNSNIYLLGDIDFEGKSFGGFGDYKGIIEGNGYKIKNFTLSYDNGKNAMIRDEDLGEGDLLCVSLFSSLNGATLRNVTFENVNVGIGTGYSSVKQILFSPICMKLANSTLDNVTVSINYKVTELPDGFSAEDNLHILTDKAYYFAPQGDKSDLDVHLTVTEIENDVEENN